MAGKGGETVAKRLQQDDSTPGAGKRASDAEDTRHNILNVATLEFADKGLAGARIDEIAEKTSASKRMIYYYFGSKEGLYRAVLERAYGAIRDVEAAVRHDDLPPDAALRQLAGLTFDHHHHNPTFVRLVMNENIHRGAHIAEVDGIRDRNRQVIATLRGILDRGAAAGVFRTGIDPVDLHMTISALCFYNVSNRYTFSYGFERDMTSPDAVARRRQVVIEIVESWCRA